MCNSEILSIMSKSTKRLYAIDKFLSFCIIEHPIKFLYTSDFRILRNSRPFCSYIYEGRISFLILTIPNSEISEVLSGFQPRIYLRISDNNVHICTGENSFEL